MSNPTYKNLKSYQQAVIICDLTVEFCDRYINKTNKSNRSDKTYGTYSSDRQSGQMIQAARSGKQNIVEGCAASKHNPQTEIKLLGVARASFEELLEDYHDFLRQNGLQIWSKDDPRSLELRRMAYKSDMSDKSDTTNETHKSDMSDKSDTTNETYKSDKTYTTYGAYKSYLDNPEKIGNALITLINQTNYLLDQQIKGVKRVNESTGVIWEGQSQRISRLYREEMEKNNQFDEWLKAEIKKSKANENKS